MKLRKNLQLHDPLEDGLRSDRQLKDISLKSNGLNSNWIGSDPNQFVSVCFELVLFRKEQEEIEDTRRESRKRRNGRGPIDRGIPRNLRGVHLCCAAIRRGSWIDSEELSHLG